MSEYPLVWRIRKAFDGRYDALPERFGQRCRIKARGARGNVLVEFEDGYTVVTSMWAVKKA